LPFLLTLHDETAAGHSTGTFTLHLNDERITLRRLVERRIREEVESFNRGGHDFFRGLIEPVDAEPTLNGFKLKERRQIDWQVQFERAIAYFESNQVFVLCDGRQIESLDEELVVSPQTDIRFLKLVPLVGG
jgi:hypothetical protein